MVIEDVRAEYIRQYFQQEYIAARKRIDIVTSELLDDAGDAYYLERELRSIKSVAIRVKQLADIVGGLDMEEVDKQLSNWMY